MSRKVARVEQGELEIYDPERGLRTIAVAEAGEKHWARAKDAKQLCKAIETKIKAQAEYVVYRDGVETIPHAGPGRGRKNQVAARKRGLPAADPGDVTAHRWRTKLCHKGKTGTVIDKEKLALALQDAQHRAVRICEQEKAGTVRGTEGTGEFERYTPAIYIEAARLVLGAIDLDPATSEIAQRTVRAEQHFTAETDGLKREWHGRVWLNPPYHRELAPLFINKLIAEITAGRVTAAIVLTNNSTDTDWFLAAEESCAAMCFTHGRIRFTQENGTEVFPTSTFEAPPHTVAEIFVTARKIGSGMEAIARDAAILLSLALQYGCPLGTIRHALTRNQDGSPQSLMGRVVDRVTTEAGS